MGIRKIGLLMGDESYGKALVKGLATNCYGLSFHLITHIKDSEAFDAIITDSAAHVATDWNRTIILASDPKEYNMENMTLFKFQGSKSLLNDLLFILSKMDRSPCTIRENCPCKVIGLYSKRGGSGVTSIAMTMAYLMKSRHNSRALYLNAEAVNSSLIYVEANPMGEDKLLKFALSEAIDIDISRYIEAGEELDYFKNGEVNQLSIASMGKLNTLIDLIKGRGDYDYIILDAGRCYEITEERLKASCEATFRILTDKELGNEENVIVNQLPIDEYADFKFPVHRDQEAFGEKEGKTVIRHYSIFTSDIDKIVENVIDMGGTYEQ